VPTAGTTLGSVRDELVVAGAGREGRLRAALAEVVEDYDLS
jgi:chromosome partitioning protein